MKRERERERKGQGRAEVGRQGYKWVVGRVEWMDVMMRWPLN